MNRVTAIIVDDESHNRSVLETLLNKHCPLINVVSQASAADEAYQQILEKSPQLVFLDIKMPQKSGFDLLRMFADIKFEVIFVSAFNEYAIQAFDFNAIGYILKPIDYEKLKATVDRVVAKINLSKEPSVANEFIKSIDVKNDLVNRITLHYGSKVVFVDINDIVVVESVDSVVSVLTTDGKKYTSSKDIKDFENLFEIYHCFFRASKKSLINVNYIESYSKGEICIVELKNGKQIDVSRRRKGELLDFIKSRVH